MEGESQKLCQERESRLEGERRREEQRRQTELLLRQQEEALLRRASDQDIGQLRRQESELRQQANALQQLLDRQEAALRSMSDGGVGAVALQPQLDLTSYQQNNQSTLAQSGNQFLSSMRPQMAPQNVMQSVQHNLPPQHAVPQHAPPPPPQQQWRGGGQQMNHSFNKRNRRF
ncbi:unnamed protein product [Oppiella nova]|uniref:Uncharacterized protein n=2 Tax=Oppiella nova TaxID=334625 RepID=A0A7R9MNE5_9ACAR|nr:unnamed protein product [Oppiella nova]CAG2180240.1 unnamed protein product [Oppiella nova]